MFSIIMPATAMTAPALFMIVSLSLSMTALRNEATSGEAEATTDGIITLPTLLEPE